MTDEWGGTLTLTEASSRELMRVLKEQDAEFMDALFNGKCGFTLKCTDGRSVELVPKDEPSKIIEAYAKGFEDGAEAVKAIKTEPQTDCAWK